MEDGIEGIGLNIGCGKVQYPKPWINIGMDCGDLHCDIRRLELPDDYADVAIAAHLIEHFYEWEAVDILLEWKRALKPGGKLILELPCMDKVYSIIAASVAQKLPLTRSFTEFVFWGNPKYKDPLMGHKWGYTYKSITEKLHMAGFEQITTCSPRYHFAERDMRIEAIKP